MSRKQSTARSKKNNRSNEYKGDETLYCENCGISFIWTVEEQRPLILPTPQVSDADVNNGSSVLNEIVNIDLSDMSRTDVPDMSRNDVGNDDTIDEAVTAAADEAEILHTAPMDGDRPHAVKRVPMSRQTAGEPPMHCPGCRQLLPSDGRERGMVKWYQRRKGYGFLTRHNEADLYVHRAAVRNAMLRPGDLVEFTLGENRQGSVATEVTVLAQEGDS